MDKIEDLKAAIKKLEDDLTNREYEIEDLKDEIEDLGDTIIELEKNFKNIVYRELDNKLKEVFESLEKVEKLEIFLNFIDSFNIDDLRALEKTKKRMPKIKINAD